MKKPAYSAALDRVLFRASRLARELGGAQTGTEHLLLALSQERISQTGRILCYQGAEGRLLRCMLLTKREQPEPSGRQGFSGAAARALDGARHEALRLGAPLCQPEHLLTQLPILMVGIVCYGVLVPLAYRISVKRFEKVDL